MANVTVIDRGWGKIQAELRRAKSLEVAVGVQQGSKNEGESIAEYATYNEFGTSDVPSRPFMATAFDESRTQIDKDFNVAAEKLLSGSRGAHAALTVIGQRHAQRIQKVITGRNFLPALAPSTVRAKKGSTKTLVDSGALVNSIQPVVRNRTK